MRAQANSLDVILRDISPAEITTHFQPIVDLRSATIFGYEALSRGLPPYSSPSLLFARAKQLALTEELEQACQSATFSKIASRVTRAEAWFVNVSPEVFCETDGATSAERVRAHGLDPARIVLEITEREADIDHKRLRESVLAHCAEGFRVALDDFGSGSNGLATLASIMPAVIKLDMDLTRGVNAHPWKRHIVRSIVSLAAAVDVQLIAEGIETWQELAVLVREGVRFGQGWLFGTPTEEPADLGAGTRELLVRAMDRWSPDFSRQNVGQSEPRVLSPSQQGLGI